MHIIVVTCNDRDFEKQQQIQIKLLKFIKLNIPNIKKNGHTVKVITIQSIDEYKKVMKKHKITSFPVVMTKTSTYKLAEDINNFIKHISAVKTPLARERPMRPNQNLPQDVRRTPMSVEEIREMQQRDLADHEDEDEEDDMSANLKRRADELEKRRKHMVGNKGEPTVQDEEQEEERPQRRQPPSQSRQKFSSVHTAKTVENADSDDDYEREQGNRSPMHPDDEYMMSKIDI